MAPVHVASQHHPTPPPPPTPRWWVLLARSRPRAWTGGSLCPITWRAPWSVRPLTSCMAWGLLHSRGGVACKIPLDALTRLGVPRFVCGQTAIAGGGHMPHRVTRIVNRASAHLGAALPAVGVAAGPLRLLGTLRMQCLCRGRCGRRCFVVGEFAVLRVADRAKSATSSGHAEVVGRLARTMVTA